MSVMALVIADAERGRLGDARPLEAPLAGRSVLEHTLRRVARVERVSRAVVIHPPGQSPLQGLEVEGLGKPVETMAHDDAAGDSYTARLRAARRWAMSGWRGGLGGATAWDELLPASAWAAAMQRSDAKAALIVGGDWCAFDPGYADELLRRFLEAPDSMRLMFTQAPPGLGPIVLSRAVIEDLAEKRATLGAALAYNPRRPAIDPIGREVCLPIAATVRDTARRFIYDSPGSIRLLERVAARLGRAFADADAQAITEAARAIEAEQPALVFDDLPDEVVLELTPRRLIASSTAPHTYAELRGDMSLDLAHKLLPQLRGKAVTFGGLGDATLHPHWPRLVEAACAAGVASLHIETDLLAPREELAALIDLPIDIVSVRLNADTAATYARVMGVDRFDEVMATLQWLFDRREARGATAKPDSQKPAPHTYAGLEAQLPGAGVPWIVPRLVKTAETLPDLEHFFERWMQVVGHAVIERPPTGGTGRCALVADRSPVPMDPPWKPPSIHQVKRRLTVLSDGTVTLCSQDWLGRAALGDANERPLLELWKSAPDAPLDAYTVDHSPVCRRCHDWWSLRGFAAAQSV